MNPLHRFVRPLRSLLGKGRLERDMAEEMRFHLEQRAADQAAEGLSPEEARYAAKRRFGNVASLQEQARADRGWRWLENGLLDLRLGVRALAKSPGFTFIAILTLGLGIGANTAMFSMLNGILLKPLPYAESDRLQRLYRATPQNPDGGFSPGDFRDLRAAAAGYGEFSAYAPVNASVAEPGRPAEMAAAIGASANLLTVLRVTPQLGRDFRSEEEARGRDRVLLLSHRCWQNRFGGRADIIGHTVRVNGVPHEIIGILPPSFNDWRHLGWVDLLLPLGHDPAQAADRQPGILRILGRPAAARTRAETDAFVAAFGVRLAAEFPETNAHTAWRSVPLNSTVMGRDGPLTFAMLIGLSGFVLLIACSNLANFLLARTMARAREFAVRGALGASRLQLLRPLVTESLLLALAGGAGAVLVARGAADYLAYRSTGDNGEQVIIHLDWTVLGWALGASLITALAFGLAPALFALRLDLNGTLKSGGRGATGGRGHQTFRHLLIIGQFALAMVLLSGATLFVRGLDELNHRRSGWTSEHLVTGTLLLPSVPYADPAKIAAFDRLVLDRLAALPGVATASLSAYTPFFDWPDIRKLRIDGQAVPDPGREPAALVNAISPGYLETMGTTLLAGRAFTARDDATALRVLLISESTARSLFGTADPVGRRLGFVGREPVQWGEVVGIVRDVATVLPDTGAVTNQLYVPLAQEPRALHELAVRTTGVAPAAVIDRIRAVMTELDPDLPVRQLQPADQTIFRANYQLGVLRDMLAAFGGLGLGLASLGIYGVIARTMAQRTNEFAIRLALGARTGDIVRLVLCNGVKLALAGAALGLVGAHGVARLLAGSYPGMRLQSPLILAGTTLLLVAVALLASWLPARRAGRVDAMTALRAE